MFCLDCFELLCFSCLSSSHTTHNIEALDDAQIKVQLKIEEQISNLEKKKNKFIEFIEEVNQKKDLIRKNSEITKKKTKEYLDHLRKLLDDKEKQVYEEIQKVENRKLENVENEIKKYESK